MNINTIYEGDCLEVMKTFPNNSINCIITSPPYWQLRDYGWSGQYGLEPTFQAYLQHLWTWIEECKRVLTDDGTIWVNLGDTYNGAKTGNTQATYTGTVVQKSGIPNQVINKHKNSEPDKCLLLIPHRFAIGCIERGLIIRNDIIWGKFNGMPESVDDRFSKKHEYFFFMVKSKDYYFDLDGIRERCLTKNKLRNKSNESYATAFTSPLGQGLRSEQNPLGKNPGSVSDFWDIPTHPSKSNHYATYNTKLIDKPIIAGCLKGAIILDPFCGTATTGCRALELGRKFIGIEGNPKYVNDARKNIQPFLEQSILF